MLDTTSPDVLLRALQDWRRTLGYCSIFAALPAITSHVSAATVESSNAPDSSAAATAAVTERPRRRIGRPAFLSGVKHRLSYQTGGSDVVAPVAGNDNCPGNQIPPGTYTSSGPFTDSGDTTGANNTVTRVHYIHYYYYWHDTPGPDHVYTFTLTARGAAPMIEVTRAGGTYEPGIYILDGRYGCPAGTGQFVYNELVSAEATAGGTTATLGSWAMSFVPLNIPLHLFVDSRHSDERGSGPYTIRMQDVTVDPIVGVVRSKFDFDGDSRSDVSVFRPTDSVWYLDRSTQGISSTHFGLPTDLAVPADFDGDGKFDIAVFRDGTWWWINSSTQTVNVVHFGSIGDKPVPADFSADGRAELAVYRQGQWYLRDLATGADSLVLFGNATDKPVVSDYDGDGRADQAVYRNGEWHIRRSRDGYMVTNWGLATDTPVVGDYDGDGRADLVVYRKGQWWMKPSLWNYYNGYLRRVWGIENDVPVPADYDGDGITDMAVFRDGEWYIVRSTGGAYQQRFGLAGDKALPAAYVP